MKKQLLVLCALMAIANGINALQVQKTFSYKTYRFDVPSQDLAVGDAFTITNVDPQADIPANLLDHTYTIWAEKIEPEAVTFKVIATPSAAPAAAEISPEKTLTSNENSILQEIISSIQNNHIPELISNLKKFPAPEIINLIQSSGTDEAIDKALATAGPATQALYEGARMFSNIKNHVKRLEPDLSEEQISQKILLTTVESGSKEFLAALKWLLEQENIKDFTGKALETTIQSGLYQEAELLVKYGATITNEAKLLAKNRAAPPESDKRFAKLLQKFEK